MYTVYAIDREGHEHGEIDCPTLEQATECLDDFIIDRMLDSEPDDPFFVRYGITFTDAGTVDIAKRLSQRAGTYGG